MSAPRPEADDGQSMAFAAGQSPGSADERQTLADIDAEIADHLASAAADLVRRGRDPEEAETTALRRFGPIASVRRSCWWIQIGDRIMFRWLAITLMAAMLIAVLALALGGWRVQTALADRLDGLTEELSSMRRAQDKLLDRPAVEMPKIHGQAYLGDASRPAANVELEIWNASNVRLFRRLTTDGEGRFQSHSLPEGDYFLLAPLLPATGREHYVTLPGNTGLFYHLQSQPLYVYPGTELDPLALDVQLKWGQVSVEIVPPRAREDAGGPTIHYRSQFVLGTVNSAPTLPADPNGPILTKEWPLRGRTDNGPWAENSLDLTFGGSVDEPLWTYSLLLRGEYRAAMVVGAHIDPEELENGSQQKSIWETIQNRSLLGTPYYYPFYSGPEGFNGFEVKAGARTHLRISIPEVIETRTRDLFAQEIKEPQAQVDLWKLIDRAHAPTPATIEVMTDQELLPDNSAR
jgi:hypothetical protein